MHVRGLPIQPEKPRAALSRLGALVPLFAAALAACPRGSATAHGQTHALPERPRARDIGLEPGLLPPGPGNAITDVPGVRVGQVTLIEGTSIRTGVTAILPHAGNLFQEKVPAAMHVGNGFGKLIGVTQVEELGVLESPIVLTNTLSIWRAADAVAGYLLDLAGNEDVRSVNAVAGETNDGYLNDIRARTIRAEHILGAIAAASTGPVAEGNVGAGTGTRCFGFKGGIGTSSRKLAAAEGGYTVGVLVQCNFGGVLQIDGLPAGRAWRSTAEPAEEDDDDRTSPDGSVMIVVATDAPLRRHGLQRLARRAMLGLARTGSTSSHGSGDYVIAFSTAVALRYPHGVPAPPVERGDILRQEALSPLFQAVIEATEEAIYNSLLRARTMVGYRGRRLEALPLDRLIELGRAHGRRLHLPRGHRPDR